MSEPQRLLAVPGKEDLEITEIYAWVAIEPNGGEAVCGGTLAGIMMPMVGADRARIEDFRAQALRLRQTTGYPIRLVRFSSRETVEELP